MGGQFLGRRAFLDRQVPFFSHGQIIQRGFFVASRARSGRPVTIQHHIAALEHRLEACKAVDVDQVRMAHTGLTALRVMAETIPAVVRAVELHAAVLDTLQDLERRIPRAFPTDAEIAAAVLAEGGIRAAARRLGIGHQSVIRRMKLVRRTSHSLPNGESTGTVVALVHGEKTEPRRTTQRSGSVNSRKRSR